MPAGIIYKITNLDNGKIYIGKTIKLLEKRFEEHVTAAKRWLYEEQHEIKHPYQSRLYPAMNLHGYDKFNIELIELVSDTDSLESREQFWISNFNSTDGTVGYNISVGGLGGALFTGHKHSDKTKQILSEKSRANIKLDQESITKRKLPTTNKFQNLSTGEIFYSTAFNYRAAIFRIPELSYRFMKYNKNYFICLGQRRNEIAPISLAECTKVLLDLTSYLKKVKFSKLKAASALAAKKRQIDYWEKFIGENNIDIEQYTANYEKYKNNCPNRHLELIYKLEYTKIRGLNNYLNLHGGKSGHKNGKITIEKNN